MKRTETTPTYETLLKMVDFLTQKLETSKKIICSLKEANIELAKKISCKEANSSEKSHG
jgi:hypothetical protein